MAEKENPASPPKYPKVEPLTRGFVDKGGHMGPSRITERPPPPAPMKPAASQGSDSPPPATEGARRHVKGR
jgi:hypothetical protein